MVNSFNDCYTLENGMKIPVLGFGTYKMGGSSDLEVLKGAIKEVEGFKESIIANGLAGKVVDNGRISLWKGHLSKIEYEFMEQIKHPENINCAYNAKIESINKEDNVTDKDVLTVSVDDKQVFQTVESIGASGSWWSQDIGGWEEAETSSLSKREYIAELLFDQTDGIGLSSYRYNLGGGSTLQNSPKITDP